MPVHSLSSMESMCRVCRPCWRGSGVAPQDSTGGGRSLSSPGRRERSVAALRSFRTSEGAREITYAGFLQLSPRLEGIGGTHRSIDLQSTRPAVVIATDDSDELECIAQWCQRQIAARPDARLLVILPGSPRCTRAVGYVDSTGRGSAAVDLQPAERPRTSKTSLPSKAALHLRMSRSSPMRYQH